jgi:hypothetical protein
VNGYSAPAPGPSGGSLTRTGAPGAAVLRGSGQNSLADVLERVLDKGVVIVGDIAVSVLDVELLSLKVRLFVASAQTAEEMGLDWWKRDPHFSGTAARTTAEDERQALAAENAHLRQRLLALEERLGERLGERREERLGDHLGERPVHHPGTAR